MIDNKNLQIKLLENSKIKVQNSYLMDVAVKKWENLLNLNKRDKNSILYSEINKFKKNDSKMSFNDFLISDSYNIIKQSGLFNSNWYLDEYEDVKYNKIDPIYHYLKMGVFEFCKPNPEFNEYDHDEFGLNPLVKDILYSKN